MANLSERIHALMIDCETRACGGGGRLFAVTGDPLLQGIVTAIIIGRVGSFMPA